MNKRNKLVAIEIILIILFIIGITLIIFNSLWIFIELLRGKYILNLNNSNRDIVENYLKQSDSYEPKQSIKNAKKIQYFMVFNDEEYTIYYKDGTEEMVYDDGLFDLREFIEKKGYPLFYKNIIFQFALIIGCMVLFEKRKEIGEEIYIIDYKNMKQME